MKITCRELEHNLRNAEILFTIAYNKAIQDNYGADVSKSLEQNYGLLINVSYHHLMKIYACGIFIIRLSFLLLLIGTP